VSGNMQPPSRMRAPSGAVIDVVTERDTLEFKNGRGWKTALDGYAGEGGGGEAFEGDVGDIGGGE